MNKKVNKKVIERLQAGEEVSEDDVLGSFKQHVNSCLDMSKDWKDLYQRQKIIWQKERDYSDALAVFNSNLLDNISKALEKQWDEFEVKGMRSVFLELKDNIVDSFEKFEAVTEFEAVEESTCRIAKKGDSNE